ncbi:hypothetical protein REPUB_Repub02eG0270400 [Reevesia pubescens]
MARFQSHSLTLLCQTLLILNFITIHPSYGDEDEEPMPLLGQELMFFICNHTSANKFCVDNLIQPAPWAKASDICDSALRSAQGRADGAGRVIANLIETSSAENSSQLLQRCQLLNNKTIEYLSSAGNNLNSDSIDDMVVDLNDAANATKTCQDIIQETTDFWLLANMNTDVLKFCEISVVATTFFTDIDFT